MNYIRQSYQQPFIDRTLYVRGVDTFKIKHGRNKSEYYNIPMGFDIETTTLYESQTAYMYIWQFGYIMDGVQYVVKGRTWDEFDFFIRELSDMVGKKRVILRIQNTSYEFGFLRGRYANDITEVFAKEKDNPIKFVLLGNIEVRDTLSLTHMSLAQIAKNYTTTQKLKGDLDYSIHRNNTTPLTEQEECYCDNDVIILCEFHSTIMRLWYRDEQIPLTQTGILRHEVKERAYQSIMDKCRCSRSKAKKIMGAEMLKLYPSEKLYHFLMTWVFQGGLTHAQYRMCDEILYNLDSFDYTSDYPAKMLHQSRCYYPAKFHAILHDVSIDEYLSLCRDKCAIACIKFEHINATTGHSLISMSKCIDISSMRVIDNGRVKYADSITIGCTELDFAYLSKFYTWKKCTIDMCWIADRMVLPEYLLQPIINNYGSKAKKKKEGENYANEKSVVNSAYGLTVQRQIESEWDWIDGVFEMTDASDYEEQVKQSVLLPQWGLYVTSWARHDLAMLIYNCNPTNKKDGTQIAYYDTDSVKGIFDETALQYIDKWNADTEKLNKEMCAKRGLDYELFADLGCLDCETSKGKYIKFKTMGAKRYLYTTIDNGVETLHQTIAGLPKDILPSMYHDNIIGAFDAFTDNMEILESNKLRKVVNLAHHEEYVDGVLMHEESSIALVPTTFKMSMDVHFMQLISNYKKEIMIYENR